MVLDSLTDAAGRPLAQAALSQAALSQADFRLTADSGFGDGWNHYAHSMAWFRGRLYVGTSRASDRKSVV